MWIHHRKLKWHQCHHNCGQPRSLGIVPPLAVANCGQDWCHPRSYFLCPIFLLLTCVSFERESFCQKTQREVALIFIPQVLKPGSLLSTVFSIWRSWEYPSLRNIQHQHWLNTHCVPTDKEPAFMEHKTRRERHWGVSHPHKPHVAVCRLSPGERSRSPAV